MLAGIETSPNPPQQRFFFLFALWHRWQQQPKCGCRSGKNCNFLEDQKWL